MTMGSRKSIGNLRENILPCPSSIDMATVSLPPLGIAIFFMPLRCSFLSFLAVLLEYLRIFH